MCSRPSQAYPRTEVVLFHVEADARVRPEQDESFLHWAKHAARQGGIALKLIGHRNCSLLTINSIVDIFEFECPEPLEWAFTVNDMMQPGAVVVIVTPGTVKPER